MMLPSSVRPSRCSVNSEAKDMQPSILISGYLMISLEGHLDTKMTFEYLVSITSNALSFLR